MRCNGRICHFLLLSLPLLLTLAVLYVWFGSEAAVRAFYRIHRWENPGLTVFFLAVSDWGNAVFYVVYAAILGTGWRRGDRKLVRFAVAYAIVQIVVSFALVRMLKIAIGRPRPGMEGLAQPWSLHPGHHALPSGHTVEITAAALPLALWRRGYLLPLGLGVLVGLEGFSRIYLGQHHPSDVLFGWLLGAVAGLAIHHFGIGSDHEKT